MRSSHRCLSDRRTAIELPFALQRRVAVGATTAIAGTHGPAGERASRSPRAGRLQVAGCRRRGTADGTSSRRYGGSDGGARCRSQSGTRTRRERAWRLLMEHGFAHGVPPAPPTWRHTYHALPRLVIDYILVRNRAGAIRAGSGPPGGRGSARPRSRRSSAPTTTRCSRGWSSPHERSARRGAPLVGMGLPRDRRDLVRRRDRRALLPRLAHAGLRPGLRGGSVVGPLRPLRGRASSTFRSCAAAPPRSSRTATGSTPRCWRRSAARRTPSTSRSTSSSRTTPGRQFIEAFMERARAGVEVRLLLDWFGSHPAQARRPPRAREAPG